MKKRRPSKLARASAYFRLAAKADRAGNALQSTVFRRYAEKLVAEHNRNKIKK